MIKVLVVDDEQIVTDAMGYILSKRQDQVVLCGTAASGREAIDQARIHYPDIVLIDIRMPGLSGIEAIEAIQSFAPETRFVIISAYEQFEYAKQALKLSVKDYLLKPINRSKVNQVIDALAAEILSERQQREHTLATVEKLRSMMPHIEMALIYSIMSPHIQSAKPETFLTFLGIQKARGYIITLEVLGYLSDKDSFSSRQENIVSQIIKPETYQQIRSWIKDECTAVIGAPIGNRIVIYVPLAQKNKVYDEQLEAMNRAEAIVFNIQRRLSRLCAAGISSVHELENLSNAYEESLKALREVKHGGIFHFSDYFSDPLNNRVQQQEQLQLIQWIELGKAEEALALFEVLYPFLEKEKANCFELIVWIQRTAADAGVMEEGNTQGSHYLKEAMVLNSQELYQWMILRIHSICKRIKAHRDSKCSLAVERCKQLVHDEFTGELTLENAARRLQMTPQYLSKIFKEQVGCTFIDYLTEVRLLEAKRLMSEGSYSIKEVCFKVGYADPNYFSRVFKKHMGNSPKDYNRHTATHQIEASKEEGLL